MLKHIPPLFTPAIMRILMEMGHGEEILFCDANYPAKTGNGEVIYITNCTVAELLEKALYYFPLDESVASAATVMESSRESGCYERYRLMIEQNGSKLEAVERFEFYRRAEKSVATIVTTDLTKGGNIILQKGVVKASETDTAR